MSERTPSCVTGATSAHPPKVRLGEVCEILIGNSAPQDSSCFESGNYPFVRTSDVGGIHFGILYHTRDMLNDIGAKGMHLFDKGSILFPKSGASAFLNHRVMLGIAAFVSSHLAVIKAGKSVDANYLLHCLATIDAKSLLKNAAYPSLRRGDIASIQLPLPPLADQRRIAATLDKICGIIEKRKAQLAQLQQLVKSRFVEMFGEGRYPIQRLSEIAEITGGLTKNGKRRTMSLKLKYLRVANVFYNRLDLSDVQEIGVEENEIPKTLLKKNDLLFVEGNGSIEQVGRVALWSGEIEPCLHQNHLIKVRLGNGIAPEYALFYFMSEAGRHQIKDCAVSTTGLHTLSTGKVANLHLPIPPLALQREFAAFVAKVDRLEAAVKKGLEAAERLYRQQLQELFG